MRAVAARPSLRMRSARRGIDFEIDRADDLARGRAAWLTFPVVRPPARGNGSAPNWPRACESRLSSLGRSGDVASGDESLLRDVGTSVEISPRRRAGTRRACLALTSLHDVRLDNVGAREGAARTLMDRRCDA